VAKRRELISHINIYMYVFIYSKWLAGRGSWFTGGVEGYYALSGHHQGANGDGLGAIVRTKNQNIIYLLLLSSAHRTGK